MLIALPRVTYANLGVDFTPVHDMVDRELPAFISELAGASRGNVIGGDADDRDGTPYTVASPIDRDLRLGEFIDASASAVSRAVATASKSVVGWAAMPWQERLILIRRWRDILDARKYELGFAALLEIGKSRMEAIGEAEEAVDQIDYYAAEMERNEGFERRLRQVLPGETTRSVLRPLGVFAEISPFNFPVALAVNAIAAALVTGNAVVFKPSRNCALTGHLVLETIRQAGLPAGTVNLVAGGDEVGRALVQDRGVEGVAFVGSNSAGMSIFRETAQGSRFAKPVIAEMGGKNPAYVTRSADLQRAAEGVARSAFGLQGQKCSACSVAYVHQSVKKEFIDALTGFAGSLQVGDSRQRDVFMGPIYGEAAAKRFDTAVSEAGAAGRVVTGGSRLAGGIFNNGPYLQPTVIDLPEAGRLTREELFLPFVAVRSFERLGAAIQEGNDVEYGLAAGIYTAEKDELDLFLGSAQAGVLYANRASGATTGAWPGIQSFCGWKGSGVSHKGGLGPHFLPQFMREQSHTVIF